jgi:hypothetical protein
MKEWKLVIYEVDGEFQFFFQMYQLWRRVMVKFRNSSNILHKVKNEYIQLNVTNSILKKKEKAHHNGTKVRTHIPMKGDPTA